jgi:eukaryotic-like serine/threonine-protein kinase
MRAQRAGRYLLHDPIASGGMASVHLGRAVGSVGFTRTVAIKRLHPHLGRDPEFVSMFLDEARIASRVQHPNVVSTIDVVAYEGELLLVMEHVLGESWWNIMRAARAMGCDIPLDIVSAVTSGMLNGLHAAHEARAESGEPLEIVHRDVSPQNVLVGSDGVARVVDFGIAKAISRVSSTRDGELKGKLAYMAPEQILRHRVDRRTDIYGAAVVLWESLTGARLYKADDAAGVIMAVLQGEVTPPSILRHEVPIALDDLVLRALAVDASARPATALELAAALESIVPPAPARKVADFVARVAADRLDERRRLVAEVEQMPSGAMLVDDGDAGVPSSRPMSAELPASLSGAILSVAEKKALAAADTSVSLVAPSPIEPPKPAAKRAAKPVLLALVLLLGVLTVVMIVALLRSTVPAAASFIAPVATDVSSSAQAVAVGAVASVPAAETIAAASSAPPLASALATSARKGAPRHVRPSTIPPATRAPAAIPAAAPATHGDCDPSYTIDASGVKRFKPWCL